MSGAVDYVGQVHTVRLRSGRELAVTPHAMGIVEGVGLVTAATRSLLDRGLVLEAEPDAVWARAAAVYYRRRRRAYDDADGPAVEWVHELDNTEVTITTDGHLVFRHPQAADPATVCELPPGNFICEG